MLTVFPPTCSGTSSKHSTSVIQIPNDSSKASPGGRPRRGFKPFSAWGAGSWRQRRHHETQRNTHIHSHASFASSAYFDIFDIHVHVQGFSLLHSVFLSKTTHDAREMLGVWSQKDACGSVSRVNFREFKGVIFLIVIYKAIEVDMNQSTSFSFAFSICQGTDLTFFFTLIEVFMLKYFWGVGVAVCVLLV